MRLRFPKPPKREAKAKSPVKRTSRPRKQRKGSNLVGIHTNKVKASGIDPSPQISDKPAIRTRWCRRCKEWVEWKRATVNRAKLCAKCDLVTNRAPAKPPRKRRKKGPTQKAKDACDKLWSQIIKRDGKCYLSGKDHIRCGGSLQAAHGFRRGYHGIRHALFNGWPLCGGHHTWYEHHDLEWRAFMVSEWGEALYLEREAMRRPITKPDYPSILVQLTEKARELGLSA